jgi:hypothetical protein
VTHTRCHINTLNAELNPICHLPALLGAHHIFHVIGLRVNASYSPDDEHSFKIGTGRLRETTLTENHRYSRIAEGGHGANNPTPEKLNRSETIK